MDRQTLAAEHWDRQDHLRYRWLKEQGWLTILFSANEMKSAGYNLDVAVDHAMKQNKELSIESNRSTDRKPERC